MEDEDAYLYGDDDATPTNKKAKIEGGPEISFKNAAADKAGTDDSATTTSQQAPSGQAAAEEEGESEYDVDDESDIEIVIDDKAGGDSSAGAGTAGTGETAERAPGIDIDQVAVVNDKPLIDVDLEKEFAEKPWRKPGADITDFFNYGFDEFTWTAYCAKQRNLREDFKPEKIMSEMMGLNGEQPQSSRR